MQNKHPRCEKLLFSINYTVTTNSWFQIRTSAAPLKPYKIECTDSQVNFEPRFWKILILIFIKLTKIAILNLVSWAVIIFNKQKYWMIKEIVVTVKVPTTTIFIPAKFRCYLSSFLGFQIPYFCWKFWCFVFTCS